MSDHVSLFDLIRNRSYFTKRVSGLIRSIKYLHYDTKNKRNSYPKLVEDSVEKYSSNIIIKYNDWSLTYSQFNKAANRIAHYLKSQGIGKGYIVALFMENRPEYLLYKLAVTKLGATVALINNSQRSQVLIHSINLVKPDAIVVGDEVLPYLEDVVNSINCATDIYHVPDKNTFTDPGDNKGQYINIAKASYEFSEENLDITNTITSDSNAWYVYTSGTTGLPKAAMQTHDRMVKAFFAMGNLINPINEDDVIYNSLPLYHSTALVTGWFSCLQNGAAFVISRKFSASNFMADVTRHRATGFVYVGEICRYLLSQPEQETDNENFLRFIIGNGLKPEIWCQFKDRFNVDEVREIYGSTEGNLTAFNIFNLDKTVGMILSPYKLVKFDQETDEPIRNHRGRLIRTRTGEPGLLIGKMNDQIRFDGYSDRSKNNGKIIRNAFKDGDKYFNTGDILKDIGYKHLQFCDRTGDTFRWKGENVSTGELENIANQHQVVGESVAYGVEIPNTNGKAGMLSIKLDIDHKKLDGQELHYFLKENLPHYSVPIFIRIVEEFKKTGTFKYLKSDLKTEGFNISKVKNPIYVALPGENMYTPLTEPVYNNINQGLYKF